MDGFERAVDLVHDHCGELAGYDKLLVVAENVLDFLRADGARDQLASVSWIPPYSNWGGCHFVSICCLEGSASAGQFLKLRHGGFRREHETRYVRYET